MHQLPQTDEHGTPVMHSDLRIDKLQRKWRWGERNWGHCRRNRGSSHTFFRCIPFEFPPLRRSHLRIRFFVGAVWTGPMTMFVAINFDAFEAQLHGFLHFPFTTGTGVVFINVTVVHILPCCLEAVPGASTHTGEGSATQPKPSIANGRAGFLRFCSTGGL